MQFSKASTYGIRSVVYIAAQQERRIISVRELSGRLQISAAFLTKVMQRLAAGEIVRTIRGFGGGVALAKPASVITLKDIIMAIDGEKAFEPFWLGIPEEQMLKTPDFHRKWKDLNGRIDTFFSTTRFTELTPQPITGLSPLSDDETTASF
ncbi:MAG: Rrf2 family transcriptional regulator [Balneolales bacterium]